MKMLQIIMQIKDLVEVVPYKTYCDLLSATSHQNIQPNEVKKTPSRRCVVCSANKSRSESRYICVPCDVGLCVDPCFEIYHTKRDFANIFAK